eukprot:CAMPEP_0119128046 /NCGR_PEP_ID=MMETSP1310-20130426/6357_1 /TAXON_ID=464262 /ORGANISM="Genus nov. species nov., Strain RCC2339" /LENGTH=483 /DNA_ID=CAMNT_0007118351 /DNA_START=184 /DNA_END=1632 /DNA_ORIENTATION=-
MTRVQSLNRIVKSLVLDDPSIKAENVSPICYGLGFPLSPADESAAIETLDPGGTGKVEIEKFVEWWSKDSRFEALQLPEEKLYNMMRAVQFFQYFDKDKDGVLSHQEFEALYRDLHKRTMITSSLEECLAIIRQGPDNSVSFTEYTHMVVKVAKLEVGLPENPECERGEDSYTATDVDEEDEEDDDCFDEEGDDDDDVTSFYDGQMDANRSKREVSMVVEKSLLEAELGKTNEEAAETTEETVVAETEADREEVGDEKSGCDAASQKATGNDELASTCGMEPAGDIKLLAKKILEQEPRAGGSGKGKSPGGDSSLNFSTREDEETIPENSAPELESEQLAKCKHTLKLYHFSKPTWCDQCGKFLWGLGQQGYICTVCSGAFHPGVCMEAEVNLRARILKSGWLYKIGSAKKDAETGKWQKRYFVLSAEYLTYYKSSKKKDFLGCVPITSRISACPEGDGSPTGFIISTPDRDFHLRANSKQEM